MISCEMKEECEREKITDENCFDNLTKIFHEEKCCSIGVLPMDPVRCRLVEEDLPDVGMKAIVQVLDMDWMKAYELSRFSQRYS